MPAKPPAALRTITFDERAAAVNLQTLINDLIRDTLRREPAAVPAGAGALRDDRRAAAGAGVSAA